MADNERKYKITFHFESQDDFLEGLFVVVEATDRISALKNVLDNARYITEWKGKIVCVNLKKFTYAECEEVKVDGR